MNSLQPRTTNKFYHEIYSRIPLPVVPLIQISPVHILLASYSLLQISLLNRAWFWAWEVQKGMSKWQSWHPWYSLKTKVSMYSKWTSKNNLFFINLPNSNSMILKSKLENFTKIKRWPHLYKRYYLICLVFEWDSNYLLWASVDDSCPCL